MTQPNYGNPSWATPPAAAAPAAPAQYTIGQVVNGHRFTGTGWEPVQAAPPPPPAAMAPPPPPPGPPGAPQFAPPPGVPAGLAPQGNAAQMIAAGGGFSGVGDAKTFQSGNYYPLGEFVIVVEEVKANISQNPKSMGAPQMIIIATVESSTVPTAVGGKYSHVINVGKFGKPDVKGFIGACLGADPGRPEQLEAINAQGGFNEAAIVQICGAGQPFKGRRLRLVTRMNGKNTFTKHMYSPIAG